MWEVGDMGVEGKLIILWGGGVGGPVFFFFFFPDTPHTTGTMRENQWNLKILN